MMITEEALTARITQLEQERQDTLSQYQALHGAIQDCQFWLEQLRAEAPDQQSDEPDEEADIAQPLTAV